MDFLFISALLYASYTDIKKREISDKLCLFIALLSLFNLHIFGIFSALPFLIAALIVPGHMGGGDIKLVAVASLYLGFWTTIYALIIGLSLSSIIHYSVALFYKNKNKMIPLAPFLSAGFIILLLI
ncbi:MAG: A24 family peptidase [Clostridia bacterium]